MPGVHQVGHFTHTPAWRDWAPNRRPSLTWGEIFEGEREVLTRLLADADHDGKRWAAVVGLIDDVQPEQGARIIDALKGLDRDRLADEDRVAISHAVRELLSRHRSHPKADWALPGEVLDRVAALLDRFVSRSLAARHAWLFVHFPSLPDGRESELSEHQARVRELQEVAVREIWEGAGLDGILATAQRAAEPWMVGVAAGRLGLVGDEWEMMRSCSDSAAPTDAGFARGYISGRFEAQGWVWAERITAEGSPRWSAEEMAVFLTVLPVGPRAWELAERLGPDVVRAYWRIAVPYGVREPAECQRACLALLDAGRPWRAIELLSLGVQGADSKPPAELIATALQAALQAEPGAENPLLGSLAYTVGELLDALVEGGELPDERLAALEWAYLPLFRFDGRAPTLLHRELARDSKFFVEAVSLAFRGEHDEPRELSDDERGRADVAFQLLEHWRTPPGTQSDGSIDGPTLQTWVSQARELLAGSGRLGIGDEQIGKVLSGAPSGTDGSWPHEAVRDVLEQFASEGIENGILVGVYNSRGVVSRSLTQGGEQERSIAEQYETSAVALAHRWPRTGEMLRRMADGYRRDARRLDTRAEFEEDY